MRYRNVPTHTEVAETLAAIGGQATAKALCDALVSPARPRRDAQLGIQRATDRGAVLVLHDWSLGLPSQGL